MFKILFAKSAEKELFNLPSIEIDKILDEIRNLATNAHPSGAIKLMGKNELWRIRSGNYRIIYSIIKNEMIIEVIRIRHRKESYKNL